MSSRTTPKQFSVMVKFMEEHGDLSRSHTPNRRLWYLKKWQDLTELLNSYGDSEEKRSEEKWRKVWSDFKNNTKKKLIKITKSLGGTGGKLTSSKSLTDLERRVLVLTGILKTIRSATKGTEGEIKIAPATSKPSVKNLIIVPTTTAIENSKDKDESVFSMSTLSPLSIKSSPKSVSPPGSPQPCLQRKRKLDSAVDGDEDYLVTHEASSKEETRERDILYAELQKEKLNVELEKEKLYAELERERIRQRDVELRQRDTALQLQAKWLELARAGLNILDKYLNDKK